MVSLELLQSFRDAHRHDNQGPVASKSVPKRLLSEGGSDEIWLLQLRNTTNLYFQQVRRKRVSVTCARFNDTVQQILCGILKSSCTARMACRDFCGCRDGVAWDVPRWML